MLLVDVYNVLHVTGVLPPHLAGIDVDGLADLIDASRYARQKALLICDGHGAPLATDAIATARIRGREARVEDFVGVLFAGRGRDADTVIESLIKRFGGQKTITVVSSDRRIARAAKGAGCRWLRSEEFLAQLAHDAERTRPEPRRPGFATDLPLTPAETRAWADAMGIKLDEPQAPQPPAPQQTAPPKQAPGNRSYRTHKSHRTYEPAPPPRESPQPPAAPPPQTTNPAAAPTEPPAEPWLAEAMRLWPDRIDLADFDMERWLAAEDDPARRKYE